MKKERVNTTNFYSTYLHKYVAHLNQFGLCIFLFLFILTVVGCSKQSVNDNSKNSQAVNLGIIANSSNRESKDNSSYNISTSDVESMISSSKTDGITSQSKSSSSNTASKKPAGNIQSSSNKNGSAHIKKDFFDISGLTGTQADVGKVVGYSTAFAADITVTSVTESVTVDGLKTIKTRYSNGTGSVVTECRYCHEFPCPDGGGTSCSQYNVQNDSTVTCQQCGKPKGDGHNGTCYRLIDWNNGGKIICNHYD